MVCSVPNHHLSTAMEIGHPLPWLTFSQQQARAVQLEGRAPSPPCRSLQWQQPKGGGVRACQGAFKVYLERNKRHGSDLWCCCSSALSWVCAQGLSCLRVGTQLLPGRLCFMCCNHQHVPGWIWAPFLLFLFCLVLPGAILNTLYFCLAVFYLHLVQALLAHPWLLIEVFDHSPWFQSPSSA